MGERVSGERVSGYTAVEIVFLEFTLRVEHDFKGGRKLSALIPLPCAGKHKKARALNTSRRAETTNKDKDKSKGKGKDKDKNKDKE
ncbi:hypothetical protein H1230_23595 [Paenibacillus sp. 19GGS1-52]|uniref:hypothetical protein n=1 Tax=Paenibacillus sp. 19GGS1-52 TaxID=2758563 RepID=UPI001EFB2DA8|nr:hypothetical protein [Paenibacillus sp. 19GGS1-52]ULO06003.1 hypothetical protein H1230_23595 [Paenibacillus sp. 19GGS1-52]